MRILIAAVVVLAVIPFAAKSQATEQPGISAAFEFRGAHFTDSISERPKGWAWKCQREQRDSTEFCIKVFDKIAEQSVTIAYTYFAGHLASISWLYKPDAFDALSEAFIAKYGPPKSTEHPEWKSQGGVTVTNTVLVWEFPDGGIRMTKYGSALDSGEAMASHAGLSARMDALEKARRAAAAKKDM